MHTDEYEITTSREITLCRQAIDRLQKSMKKREERSGLGTEAFLEAVERAKGVGDSPDIEAWRQESKELQFWQNRLKDYLESLQILKGI